MHVHALCIHPTIQYTLYEIADTCNIANLLSEREAIGNNARVTRWQTEETEHREIL